MKKLLFIAIAMLYTPLMQSTKMVNPKARGQLKYLNTKAYKKQVSPKARYAPRITLKQDDECKEQVTLIKRKGKPVKNNWPSTLIAASLFELESK